LEHEEFHGSEGCKKFLWSEKVRGNSVQMKNKKEQATSGRRFDWREDLSKSRDLKRREIDAFGYVLGWIEDWRVRKDLPAGREAAKVFWKTDVLREDRPREEWQLEQWGGTRFVRIDE